jgi:hypothetical protein
MYNSQVQRRMNLKNKREIRQLLIVAKYYFILAKRQVRKITKEDLRKTPRIFESEDFQKKSSKSLLLFTAHLGSCAVRMTTIDELLQSDRWKYYKDIKDKKIQPDDDNIRKFIHHLMRHNIGHNESYRSKDFKEIREYFNRTTFEKMYEGINNVLKDMEKEIKKIL